MSEIIKSLSQIVEKINAEEVLERVETSKEVSSRRARREAWKKPIEDVDMAEIEKIDKTFSNYVSKHMIDRVEMEEPRQLVQTEVDKLASEINDIDSMIDVLNSRRTQIRAAVFSSLNEQYEGGDGVDPQYATYPVEFIPGALESPENGIRMTREGGKRGVPGFNQASLQKLLSDEQKKKIFVEKTVTSTAIEFNEDALLEMINEGEVDLETVRECVTPGKHSSPKFQTRKLK